MANELHETAVAGITLYVRVRNETGQVWNTNTIGFENWNAGNVTDYDVALADKDGGHYVGDFPACPSGHYFMDSFIQSGDVPAVGDRLYGKSELRWNGAQVVQYILEGTLSVGDALRIMLAVLAGKSSGGGTATVKFRDVADGKDRVDATVDANGNRTGVSLDGSLK